MVVIKCDHDWEYAAPEHIRPEKPRWECKKCGNFMYPEDIVDILNKVTFEFPTRQYWEPMGA